MAQVPATSVALRLVRSREEPGTVSPLHFRAGQVASEDRAAALTANDARWVLAVRATALLEGGRAAILAPERRQRLGTLAQGMGLRPFDAAMVIAIVQDSARSGDGLCSATAQRLALVHPPASAARPSPMALLVLSALLGAGLFVWITWWLSLR